MESMPRNWISSRFRITAGIVLIVLAVLSAAWHVGLIPSEQSSGLKNQAQTVEALTATTGHLLTHQQLDDIDHLFASFVKHHETLRYVALRDHQGNRLVSAGAQVDHTSDNADHGPEARQVVVPINHLPATPASLEFVFLTTQVSQAQGFWSHPWLRLILFSGACSFLVLAFYFGVRFHSIDPFAQSQAIRDTLNRLSESLLLVNPQGQIVLLNKAFLETIQTPANKLIGCNINSLTWLDEHDATVTDFPWDMSLANQQTVVNAIMRLKHHADTLTFKVNCAPFRQGSQSLGALVCLENITVAPASAESEPATSQPQENLARSEFLTKRSRELRVPERTRLGFTEQLRLELVDSEHDQESYFVAVQANGSQLLTQLNSILDLSRIEAGKLDLDVAYCSPFEVIQDVVDVFRIHASEKNISLDFEARDTLPAFIETDPIRLQQVLSNLIANALVNIESGGIRISVSCDRSSDEPRLQFDVIDTGTGMSKQQLTELLESLKSRDQAINQHFANSNLGLLVSDRLVRMLGGSLTARSVEGQGTLFSFHIHVGDVLEQPQLSQNDYLNSAYGGQESLLASRTTDSNDVPALEIKPEPSVVSEPVTTSDPFEVSGLAQFQQIYSIAMEAIESAFGRSDFQSVVELCEELQQAVALFAIEPLQETLEEMVLAAKNGNVSVVRESMAMLNEKMEFAQPASIMDTALNETSLSTHETTTAADSPATSSVDSDSEPRIRSTLPQDAEFQQILLEFQEVLKEKIDQLYQAESAQDWEQLQTIAHWIKDSGGTVGFADLYEPSDELELAAIGKQASKIGSLIRQIDSIYQRIDVSALPPNTPSS